MIFVDHGINKNLSRDLNYIVDVIMLESVILCKKLS